MAKNYIEVLIVDDSALVREFLRETLESDPRIRVIGAASDPYKARDAILKRQPDVITLDIEMPRMDGLTFLGKLMKSRPTPVVMFSSFTESGAKATLEALSLGAVDFLAKPKSNLISSLPALKSELIEKVKAAAGVKVKPMKPSRFHNTAAPPPKLGASAVVPDSVLAAPAKPGANKIIVLGASTGGTVAIERILIKLPIATAPIAIVQHMPVHFTKAFADRLNDRCRVTVQEAVNGQPLGPGQVLIAPGGKHMLLQKNGAGYRVEVKDGPPVNRHRPSVDVLFRSAVHSAGPNALAVLLTGMGDDGAAGLLELKNSGAKTIAQDEASCVVYGMPKAAVDLGAAELVLPLDQIPKALGNFR